MKIKVLLASILFASNAVAQEATVVSVNQVFRIQHGVSMVPTVIEQCNNRAPRGLIEGATTGVFGSTSGAVGSGLGWIIGDAIGGSGATREIARVAGTIVGNSVGNNISDSNRRADCTYREVLVERDVATNVPDGYAIRVESHGNYYTVHRSFAPEIGSKIRVISQGYN